MARKKSGTEILEQNQSEWQKFWEFFKKDALELSGVSDQSLEIGKIDRATLKELTKNLSNGRRRINQQLEKIKSEIDSTSSKIESIRLVGGEDAEAIAEMNRLHDLGEKLSEELSKLNEKLKQVRKIEDQARISL
jgi:uncharacterized phage infection (PIP) family protein YhgE